jgi:hypothetical protein
VGRRSACEVDLRAVVVAVVAGAEATARAVVTVAWRPEEERAAL